MERAADRSALEEAEVDDPNAGAVGIGEEYDEPSAGAFGINGAFSRKSLIGRLPTKKNDPTE